MALSVPVSGYALVFGLAALVCLAALPRARAIDDRHTRYGLVGLLAGSAGWAGSHVGLLVAPTNLLKEAIYIVGLTFGFATVFAWLYFASSYTGRHYHRDRPYRLLGAGLYLGVVAVKVTNPLHEFYFTAEPTRVPFAHLAIQQQWFHWVVTGLSYSLAAIGLFMLFEMFSEADYDTRPLAVLAGITGLPVVFDLLGYATDLLVGIIYAPLGVAVFAVGVLYVFDERFLAVQLTGDIDDPVVFLDREGRVTDYNRPATALFPDISGSVGDSVSTLPGLEDAMGTEQGILEVRDSDGDSRYFLVSQSSFDLGQTDIGTVLLFSDVTRIESQRRELSRHNDQLESFATGIRHELRNTLQVVGGHVEAAGDALESGDVSTARSSMATASDTAGRMERTVDDLSTLARHGQTVTDEEQLDFAAVARRTWDSSTTGDLSLSVEGEGEISANPSRLEELFESAYTFARYNDASEVRLRLADGTLTITDDGTRPADHRLDKLFDYGAAVPNAEAGMAMPNVETLAGVHGWSVGVDRSYDEGVRVTIEGIAVSEPDPVETD